MKLSMIVTLLSFTLLLLSLPAPPAHGEVVSKVVEYQDGDVTLKGEIFWDDDAPGQRPGVLVVHEWWGLNDHARQKARRLAEAGYVALATDMYGGGQVAEHPREAGEFARQVRENVEAWRRRANVGLEQLKKLDRVDSSRLAAIGYCFGGATVIQMAYGGSDVQAVVSFHGSLPMPTEGASIDPAMLINHGAEDAHITPEVVQEFITGMNTTTADWQMNVYADAPHSFTNESSQAYTESADRRSWAAMLAFFDEILGE